MPTRDRQEAPTRESVCAVVPTYNCEKPLANCLEAVRRQTRPVDEIIVVDNASTDGTREMIQERFGGSLTYIRLPENLGGAGGFDRGMRLACDHKHNWIWCLDSDALPFETTLQDMLSATRAPGPPVVAVTGILRDPPTGELYPAGQLQRPISGGGTNPWRANAMGHVEEADVVTLCCLLVRAEAARRAGFIRQDLFIYDDDLFFSRALRTQGQLLLLGNVVAAHRLGRGRYTLRRGRRRLAAEDYWRNYYLFRNRFLFEKGNGSGGRVTGRYLCKYLRGLTGILVVDDYKSYRTGVLTRAFLDGLLGRTGKRVDPQDFRNKYGAP